MKTLKLTLKKQWFDMILFGQKKEEYREIKGYWVTRLIDNYFTNNQKFKDFDYVEFTNGYNKNSPTVTLDFLGICEGKGKKEWGAVENETYFIIKLGSEVSRKNC